MKTTKTHQLSLKEYKNIFDDLYKSLCLFTNNYVNDIDISKDLVQDVFIKIWEEKIEFKNKNAIKSFLYTSVKNKSLDYLKSKRYKSTETISSVKLEQLETNSFFMREFVLSETAAIIEKSIDTLPNRCAQIIRLSINNFSNPEIAQYLNISINTVKAQKKIAYKRLKPLLKEHLLLILYIFN